ncbi:hypothetical protein [Pseudoalteromonas luteoviolacea]|uniref:Uncharacterized protein n=1 Tax=Pseudoalteromonas luteoviolacea S4054 TaxID=1129367 RepID=A0A0F6A4I7_9GAMM|nr:hypothetical protein [Pseudoalteromonas luteoviolacea]AOT06555.1 hypothetical protein S4054249_01050 [Pseudoalteromonas luteoviolacea]AOT11472.1 hypothetical protein S40542_01050 [Pseudoalteromonas luteoviolacea]AOT16385.1 hypothetical protein S4054_01050 [Pseudoalteromonas luteoviolacea]KKE81125.1 hypothetical protein N479_03725 [Pseudoalteromonas luteoviolacea S4054]KZN62467.1 hypothetical protein N481_03210 [Pseudoalteromonas luteoviolacea S4047-1]
MRMKFGIVFGALLLNITGCKTLDSVQTLGGSSPSHEQVQAAYDRADAAYQEAQQAMYLANTESLLEYDRVRIEKAQKEWRELEKNFADLKAKPFEALDSASFFSSQTVSGEIIELSQEVLALVAGAQAAKQLILSVLEPVRSHFAVLDKFAAQENFPKRYRKLSDTHRKFRGMLVNGKQPEVEARLDEFNAQLSALEVSAVELHYLGEIKLQLRAIKTSLKAKVLPSVVLDAANTSEYATAYIQNNMRDYEQIEDKVRLAKLQILRVESLYQEHIVRKNALKDNQVEAQLLTFESQLLALTEKAGLGDLRHLSFAEQLAAVKGQF